MNKKQWLYALIISTLVGLVFTLAQTVFSSGGRIYLKQIESRYLQEQGLTEDHEYIEGRVKQISGLESLLNALQYRIFWKHVAITWLVYSFMGLICCFFFARANDRIDIDI